jgi:hypothetical protein
VVTLASVARYFACLFGCQLNLAKVAGIAEHGDFTFEVALIGRGASSEVAGILDPTECRLGDPFALLKPAAQARLCVADG